MADSQGTTDVATFIVSGEAFIRARKNLKPAYPKKKQEATASVGFASASRSQLSIQLPGASATLPAITSSPFSLQMPWLYVKQLMDDPIDGAAIFHFQVGNGLFKCGDIAVKSNQIVFKSNNDDDPSSRPAEVAANLSDKTFTPAEVDGLPMPDLINAPMDFPLLGAYSYIRKFGYQRFLGNRTFVAQEAEVIRIFKKAVDLLAPLGLRREDLQKILDERHGISGDYPIEETR
jgi:hypothetical protein